MSLDFYWVNPEKSILLIQITNEFSTEEARLAMQEVLVQSADSVDSIELIIDRQQLTGVPKNMLSLVNSLVPKMNYSRMIMVGFPTLPRMIAETLSHVPRVFKSPPIFVDTLEEAYSILNITTPSLTTIT